MVTLCILIIIGVLVYSYVIKPRMETKAESLEPKAESQESRVESQESKVESRESRAESQESRVESRESKVESRESRVESQEARVESQETRAEAFPYPAKNPSGCHFPGEPEISNFQEYGEEPVELAEEDFKRWWFFCEDLDKPCWSHVGTDKTGHCILQRRYRHGTPDHYTFDIRHFRIKRNIMASAFALAMMKDLMERRNYFELMERLDQQFPPTGNPEIDGPEILLPPQELLDNPSKEEIKEAALKKEREELPGKVVYQDDKRKLYFAQDGHTPMFDYEGKTYSLSCHPYEPMLIIRKDGADVAYVHNAFYPDDEYKGLLKGQLVHSITGMYHNAERFARILSTAVDTSCDRIEEIELMMLEDLVLDKGDDAIEYASYDFKCDRVLYEGVAVLLGHFICYHTTQSETLKNADEVEDLFVYALAFGFPHNGKEMYEYYLISPAEYREYKEWTERQEWKNHEAAYKWHETILADKQVLCNEFSHMKTTYKPFFRFSELPKDYYNGTTQPYFFIKYSRESVCAQDDYVNHDITIELPYDATIKDLVDYIAHYQDADGFAAIPYTGGHTKWKILAYGNTLAELYDDAERIHYFGAKTLLRTCNITEVSGLRV